MRNHIYYNPTKIIFGAGTELGVGEYVVQYGKKVMLHYGGGSIKRSGLYKRVTGALTQAGVDFVELGGVEPNPKSTLVRRGVELCRQEQVDFILAVGGGSVIDSAKAIAVGVPYEGDFWDFYVGKAVPQSALQVGGILTIPAAGSESSNSSVITDPDIGYKRFLDSDLIRLQFAILNPELTYSLPTLQTKCGVIDAISHVFERYFTQDTQVACTDAMCEGILRVLFQYGRMVLTQPEDYDVRAEIMWACKVAHDGCLGVGRQEDWGAHMIEHEISAENDVIHGVGLSVIIPAWMKYIVEKKPRRLAMLAHRVFGITDGGDELGMAYRAIEAYEEFLRQYDMPRNLAALGVPPENFEHIAARCVEFGEPVGHYKELYRQDIIEVLKIAANQ